MKGPRRTSARSFFGSGASVLALVLVVAASCGLFRWTLLFLARSNSPPSYHSPPSHLFVVITYVVPFTTHCSAILCLSPSAVLVHLSRTFVRVALRPPHSCRGNGSLVPPHTPPLPSRRIPSRVVAPRKTPNFTRPREPVLVLCPQTNGAPRPFGGLPACLPACLPASISANPVS